MSTFEVSHCWSCGKRFGARHDGLCSRCRGRVTPVDTWKLAVGVVVFFGLFIGFAFWAACTGATP